MSTRPSDISPLVFFWGGDFSPANSANCCSGSFDTPATCPPSGTCRTSLQSFLRTGGTNIFLKIKKIIGVQFYDYFKSNCPNSYVYAYDESSDTALWTCDSDLKADYTLTFCP